MVQTYLLQRRAKLKGSNENKIPLRRSELQRSSVFMSNKLISWLILFALVLTWGSSFILIKKGLLFFDPAEVGALRVVITFLFLLPFAVKRLRKLKRNDFLWLSLSGIIGNFFPAFLFAAAQKGINSSTAGLLNSLTPLFTLLVGISIFKLKTKPLSIFGVFVGLAGAIGLISVSGGHSFSFNIGYASLIVLATIMYAVNVNIIKAKLQHIDSITITAITFFVVGFPALVVLFGFTGFVPKIVNNPVIWEGIGYIAILAVVGTALAMMAFNVLIKITGPVFASSVTYLIPVVALLWGVTDGEHFEASIMLWISLIIAGVVLVNLNYNKKPLITATKQDN